MKFRLSLLIKISFVVIFCLLFSDHLLSGTLENDYQLNTTLMAHLSCGACETLELKGDTVIMGSGNSLIMLVLNPDDTFQLIGSTTVHGRVHDLIVINNSIFVLSEGYDKNGWYSKISIIKISQPPTNLSVVGSIKFHDNIEGFAYHENRIFLHCGESDELNIVNIENPDSPYIEKVIGRDFMIENQWPYGPLHFEFKDALLYLVSDEITVVSVSNKLEFETIAHSNSSGISGATKEVIISDQYLYILDLLGFSIYDISTLKSISQVTFVENTGFTECLSLVLKNNYLYILSALSLFVYDISNPQIPKLVIDYQSNSPLSDIKVKNNRVFITRFFEGLFLLDHNFETMLSPVSSYNPPRFLKKLFLKDNRLYTTSSNSELLIINITNLTNPFIEGLVSVPGFPQDVVVNDNISYVAVPEKIYLVNTADPSNFAITDSILINEFSPSLDIKDNKLYVADGSWGLKIFDISSSETPRLLGTYSNNKLDARDILVKGKYAYVLNFAFQQLDVFDISDPTLPSMIYEIQANVGLDAESSIWLDHLFVPTTKSVTDFYSQKIEIFDISNPETPIRNGEIDLADNIFSTCGASGDYLFTISRANGLRIFHVDDPFKAEELGYYSFMGSYQLNSSMIVHNNIVMIVNDDGLYIIKNENNSLPSLINCMPDTTIAKNNKFQFQYEVIDVDNDALSFQIENQCHGFNIDESTGFLEYTPGTISRDTTLQLVVAINDTKSTKRDTTEINIIGTTDVLCNPQAPAYFSLENNYPNPFNAETTIRFELPQNSHVRLEIYNLLGQRVTTLLNSPKPAGRYTLKWDGKDQNGNDVASGIYFYKLVAGDFRQIKKMVLTR